MLDGGVDDVDEGCSAAHDSHDGDEVEWLSGSQQVWTVSGSQTLKTDIINISNYYQYLRNNLNCVKILSTLTNYFGLRLGKRRGVFLLAIVWNFFEAGSIYISVWHNLIDIKIFGDLSIS